MYQYTDSGLDNIQLVNGYTIKETPYGEAVSIDDVDGLHKAIGRWIIYTPKPLSGAELRFLRHELDLSQKSLGAMLGKSEQAVRRWEKAANTSIEPTADRLVRVIYSDSVEGNGPIKKLIDLLTQADQLKRAECLLEESNGRWHVADPAFAA